MMSKERNQSHTDELPGLSEESVLDYFSIEDKEYGVKATLYVRNPEDLPQDSDLCIVLRSKNGLIDLDKRLFPLEFRSWFAKSYFLLESKELKRRVTSKQLTLGDAYVEAVCASLSRKTVEHLMDLSDNNKSLLRKIDATRALKIKEIACAPEFSDFFAKVVDLVTFKTSDSRTLPLGEYCAQAKNSIWCLEGTADWGCYPVDREIIFLCSEYEDERDFIKRLQRMNLMPVRYYVRERKAPKRDIYGREYTQYWRSPDAQDFAAGKNQSLTEALDIPCVKVQAGHLAPNLPAIIVNKSNSGGHNTLSAIFAAAEKQRPPEPEILKLNIDHPMVGAVLSLTNRELLREAVRAFYYNALLLSGECKDNEMKMAHDAFFDVMGHLLDDYHSQHVALPEHTRIFMAMPYQGEFDAVENAVRQFLEGPPYYFELFLDRDRTSRSGELLDNLRTNIGAAKGMIADISGLNDNVLMELGVIHLRYGEKRPLFLICSSEYQDKYKKNPTPTTYPADLGDKLITFYKPSTQQEDIYQFLKDQMPKKQVGLQDLLKDRRAKYLSDCLLWQFRKDCAMDGINFEDGVFNHVSEWIRDNYKNDLELLEADEEVWRSELEQKGFKDSIAVVSSLKNWLKERKEA